MKAATGPRPSVRATSSGPVSASRSAASTGIVTYGVQARTITPTSGQNPSIPGHAASHANAVMYEGIASGSDASTHHSPGAGSRTRATATAVATPRTRQPRHTATTSSTVLRASSHVRGRVRTSTTRSPPAWPARTTR